MLVPSYFVVFFVLPYWILCYVLLYLVRYPWIQLACSFIFYNRWDVFVVVIKNVPVMLLLAAAVCCMWCISVVLFFEAISYNSPAAFFLCCCWCVMLLLKNKHNESIKCVLMWCLVFTFKYILHNSIGLYFEGIDNNLLWG